MGFETFQVELRDGSASHRDVSEAVRRLPYVRPDAGSLPMRGSTYYVFDDGHHVIELELVERPVRLSCRFTLCHPATVDAVFLRLLRELMERLRMAAMVCDVVPPEAARSFAPNEFAEFSSVTSRCIAVRRAEWIGAFGDEPLAATTNEVYQRVILPRCRPGVGQAM